MELLIFPLLLIVMWYFIMRPQQRRMKEHRALLASLDVGDEVVTSSGIYGAIAEFDGDTVFLLVAPGVQLKVTRESIAGLVRYDDDTADNESR